MENNKRHTVKLNVVRNFKDSHEIRECEYQTGLKRGKLLQKLNAIGRLMHDESFVQETLQLNENITSISEGN